MSKVLTCKCNVRLSIDAICRLFQIHRLYLKYGLASPSVTQIIEGAILSIKISELEQEVQRISALENNKEA